MLYSQADLALSSVSYWYDYEYSGAMDVALRERYGDMEYQERMAYSIFGGMQRSRWRVIGGADVIGCAAGVADKAWLGAGGPVGWKVLAGACAVWGIGGSAATWWAM